LFGESFDCLFDRIVTPLAMDQWGWSEEDAIYYLGITMAGGGILVRKFSSFVNISDFNFLWESGLPLFHFDWTIFKKVR